MRCRLLSCLSLAVLAALPAGPANGARLQTGAPAPLSATPAAPALAAPPTAPLHAQPDPLPAPVAQALQASGLAPESLSVIVLRGKAVVLAHRAAVPAVPASTMKIVTTAVALERLGPVFRGRTELLSSAPVVRGELQGDLVLRGGADMDLDTQALETMLRALRYRGIRRIAGNLVVDRSVFTPARPEQGAPAFDEWPNAYYNVIPDAALINRNMLDIDLRSTGRRMQVSMWPPLDQVSVRSALRLIDAPCARWEDGWQAPEVRRGALGRLQVVLHGTFPKNCMQTNSLNVLDRQDYIERIFRAVWRRLGGQWLGQVAEGTAPDGAELLAAHVSRALPELVRDTNKPSDNALARTIFLALGSLQPDPVLGSRPLPPDGPATTLERADATVRAWLRQHGIDDAGLVLENGSGLSRIARITPRQLAGVLAAAAEGPWAPEFASSLPIVGLDGTMRRRLHDSPAAGHARMKSGTLRDVMAVAGYVPDGRGQQCVVVAMVNDPAVGHGHGRAVLDALVDWVARSGAPE
jgi:D-alanyl-D-alanine carboxypeptidase/D-alanyl-D-alanine-endopeptidase (penicillin-binding protein 4)